MALELCWLCPSDRPRRATWMQQVDHDTWFTPLCDQHCQQADHQSPRLHYWRAGEEPRQGGPAPVEDDDPELVLPD